MADVAVLHHVVAALGAQATCSTDRSFRLVLTRSGFSVHVGEPVSAQDPEALERLGRYGARAPVSMKRVFLERDGRVKYLTDPDPRTGATHVHFDPLDWIHALVRQIPDPRMHMVRYQGAYANRVRRRYCAEEAAAGGTEAGKVAAHSRSSGDLPWEGQVQSAPRGGARPPSVLAVLKHERPVQFDSP